MFKITPSPRASAFGIRILGALQGKHVYQGTVPAATVEKRRKRNKIARTSRRNNRSNA